MILNLFGWLSDIGTSGFRYRSGIPTPMEQSFHALPDESARFICLQIFLNIPLRLCRKMVMAVLVNRCGGWVGKNRGAAQ